MTLLSVISWDKAGFDLIYGLRRDWLDPFVRIMADSGLGQVQLFALLTPIILHKWGMKWMLAASAVFIAASPFVGGHGVFTAIACALMIPIVALWKREVAVLAIWAGALAGLIRVILAKTIERPRPSTLGYSEPLENLFGATSFPSGHATTTAAIAAVAIYYFARTDKAVLAWAALAWWAFVGFSRVYSGVHFPMDVLAGTCLGIGVAMGVCWWNDRRMAEKV